MEFHPENSGWSFFNLQHIQLKTFNKSEFDIKTGEKNEISIFILVDHGIRSMGFGWGIG